MRLVGSLAIHAVLVGALLRCGQGERRAAKPTTVPPIAVAIVTPPRPATAVTAARSSVAGAPGGSSRTTKPDRAVRRRSIIGEVRYETGGDAGRQGSGGGRGNGTGTGIGFGAGGGIAALPDPGPPPPPPPPVVEPRSKARPPRLIYPARHRELDDSQLFVARVSIDRDGYVVGAKLVRGRGGPRDDEASSLIFRFRYEPALDDAGRAIAATIEQPFGVQ